MRNTIIDTDVFVCAVYREREGERKDLTGIYSQQYTRGGLESLI